eukprot:TRINITY_DN8997_c1_g1_i1.p1 TRINITY_DN8997_c1_g1~~TRINITY_DN8997_c1_g1_i1.p1  ORF type:complete len:301 (+),score=65.37 TRINITY_DN8997_c1_g1_i1:67-903(+)
MAATTAAKQLSAADLPYWDASSPDWTSEELQDVEIGPAAGSQQHSHTLIYLHGYGGRGKGYLPEFLERLPSGFPAPWIHGRAHAPGLRVVLPTARRLQQPWGPTGTAWHGYVSADSNQVGDTTSLDETRYRLAKIIQDEISTLRGGAEKVFLGGFSQGCAAALDVYLREGSKLGLGGFVGSVGFVPSDKLGFRGADAAIEMLIKDAKQAARPLWLQSAKDDEWIPWGSLVKKSLKPMISAKVAGLKVKTVSGRGHLINDWEGCFLADFICEHAPDSYT